MKTDQRTLAFGEEIIEGLHLLSGSLPSGANVTSAILASEGEALYIDSLYYPKETLRMIEIAEHEELDSLGLVNTHWHLDHTAGNCHFNMRGIGHEKCPGLMKTDLPSQLENAKPKIGPVLVKYPDWTFQQKLTLTVGEKEVTLIHLPGHTPDSIVGLVEKDHLLIAGDSVMELLYITYGRSEALLESLRLIQGFDVSLILQGHGQPCSKEKLDGDIRYIENLRTAVREESE